MLAEVEIDRTVQGLEASGPVELESVGAAAHGDLPLGQHRACDVDEAARRVRREGHGGAVGLGDDVERALGRACLVAVTDAREPHELGVGLVLVRNSRANLEVVGAREEDLRMLQLHLDQRIRYPARGDRVVGEVGERVRRVTLVAIAGLRDVELVEVGDGPVNAVERVLDVAHQLADVDVVLGLGLRDDDRALDLLRADVDPDVERHVVGQDTLVRRAVRDDEVVRHRRESEEILVLGRVLDLPEERVGGEGKAIIFRVQLDDDRVGPERDVERGLQLRAELAESRVAGRHSVAQRHRRLGESRVVEAKVGVEPIDVLVDPQVKDDVRARRRSGNRIGRRDALQGRLALGDNRGGVDRSDADEVGVLGAEDLDLELADRLRCRVGEEQSTRDDADRDLVEAVAAAVEYVFQRRVDVGGEIGEVRVDRAAVRAVRRADCHRYERLIALNTSGDVDAEQQIGDEHTVDDQSAVDVEQLLVVGAVGDVVHCHARCTSDLVVVSARQHQRTVADLGGDRAEAASLEGRADIVSKINERRIFERVGPEDGH